MSVTYAAGGSKSIVSYSTVNMVTTNSTSAGGCVTDRIGGAEHNHLVFNAVSVQRLNQAATHTYLTNKTSDNVPVQVGQKVISTYSGNNPLLTELLRSEVSCKQFPESNPFSWKVSATPCNEALRNAADTENRKKDITDSAPVSCPGRGRKRTGDNRDDFNNDRQLSGPLDKKKYNNQDDLLTASSIKTQFNDVMGEQHDVVTALLMLSMPRLSEPPPSDPLDKREFNNQCGLLNDSQMKRQLYVFMVKQYDALIEKLIYLAKEYKNKNDKERIVSVESVAEGKQLVIDCSDVDQVIKCFGGKDLMSNLLKNEADNPYYDTVRYKKKHKEFIVVDLKKSPEISPFVNSEGGYEINDKSSDFLHKQHQALIAGIVFLALEFKKTNQYKGVSFTSSAEGEIEIAHTKKDLVINYLGGGATMWQLLNMAAEKDSYDYVKYKEGEKKTITVDLKSRLTFFM